MKIYKDLIIKGSEEALKKFKDSLSLNIFPSWECIVENKNMPQYIGICYKGKDFPMSGLTILKTDSQYEVANIVPLTQNQLSYDEYNGILQLFYDDFLKNNKRNTKLVVALFGTNTYDKLRYYTNCTYLPDYPPVGSSSSLSSANDIASLNLASITEQTASWLADSSADGAAITANTDTTADTINFTTAYSVDEYIQTV